MQTMIERAKQTPDFAYWGESEDWLVAYGVHRDSDVLERANFEALRRIADAGTLPENEDEKYRIESASHWVVGWTETLLINPKLDAETIARIDKKITDARENYPVIDDELYSDMEYEEACSTAEMALYELGVPSEIRKDVAPYVVEWGIDAGNQHDYRYRGVSDYWPSKESQFWGYVAYRRSLR